MPHSLRLILGRDANRQDFGFIGSKLRDHKPDDVGWTPMRCDERR
jgi:hypothetical protein